MQLPDPVSNRNLFSETYLLGHFREEYANVEIESRAAYAALRELYLRSKPSRFTSGKEKVLREEFLDAVLEVLGWAYSSEGHIPGAGIPDYTLFLTEEEKQVALDKQTGSSSEGLDFFSDAAAVAEVKTWGASLFSKGREERSSPRSQLYSYLEETRLRWGILTNGKEWMLACRDYSRAQQRDYTVDLEKVLQNGEWTEDFNFFFLFFRRAAFAQGFPGKAIDQSRISGEGIGKDLKANVYQALEILARELHRTMPNLFATPEGRRRAKENCLILLYRILFISYAESRGVLPMGHDDFYRKSSSLLRIKEAVKAAAPTMRPEEYERIPGSHYLRMIRRVFSVIDKGFPPAKVPAYNGGLFDSAGNPFLENLELNDRTVARIVDLLSRSPRDPDRFLDFSYLGVRELGSIYEGLLEYDFRVADEDIIAIRGGSTEVWEKASGASARALANAVHHVSAGSVYLANDRGERKVTGSYYTPHSVVMQIVEDTLGPIVDRKIVEANGSSTPEVIILSLRILDPSMGSGHFLVAATEYLAERLIQEMDKRYGPDQDPAQGEEVEAWAKRQVVSNCIYGVDLNPMAVELAKVSLWLTTFSRDHPLSFLDNRLRQGNSLTGARLDELQRFPMRLAPQMKKPAKQKSPHKRTQASITDFGLFINVKDKALEIEKVQDETLAGVERKKNLYSALVKSDQYTRLRDLGHLYVSLFYLPKEDVKVARNAWDSIVETALAGSTEAWEKMKTETDWIAEGIRKSAASSAFHWDLEFPEVFAGPNPGFHVALGNPPYVRIYRGSLAEEDIEFYKLRFSAAHMKFDLYLLFIELALKLARAGGRIGFIIPDKFATSPYGEPLRELLLANRLEKLYDLRGKVIFPGVGVENVILIAAKDEGGKGPARVVTILKSDATEAGELAPLRVLTQVPQHVFASYPQSQIRLSADFASKALLDKLLAASIPLERAYYVNWGLRTGTDERTEKMISAESRGPRYRPLLRGEDIAEKYVLYRPPRYIDYDPANLYNSMFPELFESPKLIFRKIAGPEGLMAVVDEKGWYCFSTLICVVHKHHIRKVKRQGVDPPTKEAQAYRSHHLVLAICNSRIVSWWYKQSFSDDLGVNPNHVNAIPLPKRLQEDTPETRAARDWLADAGRDLQTIGDEIAREKTDFLAWLEREFFENIGAATGRSLLPEFETMDFDAYLSVIRRNKKNLKRDPSRREVQEDLRRELENSWTKLRALRARAAETNARIEPILSGLFGLAPTEISQMFG